MLGTNRQEHNKDNMDNQATVKANIFVEDVRTCETRVSDFCIKNVQ